MACSNEFWQTVNREIYV